MTKRAKLKTGRRWVVKIGSALLSNDGQGLDFDRMQTWVEQMSVLIADGVELCLVSSGAIAVGLQQDLSVLNKVHLSVVLQLF